MQDNTSELQKAQLAQSFSASEPLKQLAQKIVKNRSTANAELKSVAEQQQFGLPAQPRPGQKDIRSNLRDLKGSEFQKAYTQEEIQAHDQEIALYRKEADSGTDAGLKKYAQQFLPVLQDELKSAQSVQSGR